MTSACPYLEHPAAVAHKPANAVLADRYKGIRAICRNCLQIYIHLGPQNLLDRGYPFQGQRCAPTQCPQLWLRLTLCSNQVKWSCPLPWRVDLSSIKKNKCTSIRTQVRDTPLAPGPLGRTTRRSVLPGQRIKVHPLSFTLEFYTFFCGALGLDCLSLEFPSAFLWFCFLLDPCLPPVPNGRLSFLPIRLNITSY